MYVVTRLKPRIYGDNYLVNFEALTEKNVNCATFRAWRFSFYVELALFSETWFEVYRYYL